MAGDCGVAKRIDLQCETCAAAAGGGGLWIVDAEGGADEVIDEVDLGAGEIAERYLVDQHPGAVAGDDDIVRRLRAVDIELVLETGAAAAFHAQPEHGAGWLAAQDLPDSPRRSFGDRQVFHSVCP